MCESKGLKRAVLLIVLICALSSPFCRAAGLTAIYSDDFSGTGLLNGTAPDVRPGQETWVAASVFNADGNVSSATLDGYTYQAWLPFTPMAGQVYVLSLDVDPQLPPGTSDWFGLGFSNSRVLSSSLNDDQFWTTGIAWILQRVSRAREENEEIQTFLGPGVEGGQDHESKEEGVVTLSVVLDTTGDMWTVEWFRNGQSIRGPDAYETNPTINFVGLTKVIETSGTIDNFSLKYVNPTIASEPVPADEQMNVPRDVILNWSPGMYADTHDIYIGTSFYTVNAATVSSTMDVLAAQGHDSTTYDAGRLEFGQTYYWRVDEVSAPPESTVYKGNVWSFTVEPVGYPIPGENITATASSSEAAKGPENTINDSGLDETGLLHGNIGDGNMWLSSSTGQQPTWIEYEFDKVYKLHQMLVWNSNESLEPAIGLGIRDVTIEYSVDGVDYMTLGTAHEFAQAPGMPGYAHNTTVEFNGTPAKYVRLTANSNWGGILTQYGLSEVRFLSVPVHAIEPNPTSESIDVALDLSLGWKTGREAAEHNVYFSDDQQAVIEGTADVATVTDTSYGPLSLDLGKTYYWRVDEVNGPDVWQGDIWDFTTYGYFVVDDFEDYNDYDPHRVWQTWIDGYEDPANGAQVGYTLEGFDDFGEVETSIVHGGFQSMPFFFDNTTAIYSEATMTLSSQQNWTERGIGSLRLWFRGHPKDFVEEPAGTYAVSATGADIWSLSNEFRYVYKQLSGPGSIIAKVESVENTDDWAKAGVMIRQTLASNSKYAAVYITPANGCRYQARLIPAGEATSDTTVATDEQIAITAPYWVKLEREASGNFNGYYSSDGVNWVPMAWNPQTISMPTTVYIGLALTSHNPLETCTAVFSNVQTTGAVSPEAWTQEAIGVDMASNDAAQLYVVLNDSAVVYYNNPGASQIDEWTQWNIDLQDFADRGVDLIDVDTLGIGFGNRENPQPDGTGLVFFDDIRLYPPQP